MSLLLRYFTKSCLYGKKEKKKRKGLRTGAPMTFVNHVLFRFREKKKKGGRKDGEKIREAQPQEAARAEFFL